MRQPIFILFQLPTLIITPIRHPHHPKEIDYFMHLYLPLIFLPIFTK